MKEFFLDLLYQLDKLAGIQQMNKLLALPEEDSRREISELLEILCRTSDLFPLIPKNAQKLIIKQAVISDSNFIGLNARFVYNALNAQRERFFKEAAHIPTEPDPDWKPLEGEERQKKLQEWMEALQKTADTFTSKSHVQELVERLPPKKGHEPHPSTPPERVQQILARNRELQIKALRDKHPGASDEEINKLIDRL